jgi:hypothetical protein
VETPQWVLDALYSLVPAEAPGLTILTPDGLWNAILEWDNSPEGSLNPFLWGTDAENKYQLAAFLANTNQETLQAFAYSMDPNYGINEIVCNGNVGYTDWSTPGAPFVQDPTPCTSDWGGEYGLYWGRGAMQVTCRVGTGPGGSDYCAAYSDMEIFYGDYLAEKGWDLETEPYHVALDPTLAWGSALVYWMRNVGAGCYTCHEWGKLRDFAGTVETINGGWENGEAPMSHPPSSRQQNRVNAFITVTNTLGLNAQADGWNGLSINDPSPCEVYLPSAPQYCFERSTGSICDNASLPALPGANTTAMLA